MIPDEAVEAAAKRYYEASADARWDYLTNYGQTRERAWMRLAIEAAAPHLIAAEDARRKSEALAAYPLGVNTIVSHDEGGVITVTHAAGGRGMNIGDEGVEAVAYTEQEVFPYAWDGPVETASLHECALCGAAVAGMGSHADWHNKQRSAGAGG